MDNRQEFLASHKLLDLVPNHQLVSFLRAIFFEDFSVCTYKTIFCNIFLGNNTFAFGSAATNQSTSLFGAAKPFGAAAAPAFATPTQGNTFRPAQPTTFPGFGNIQQVVIVAIFKNHNLEFSFL